MSTIPFRTRIAVVCSLAITASCTTAPAADESEPRAGQPADHQSAEPAGEVELPGPEEFDTSRAYVATIEDGSVTALDLENNEVSWTLQVSEGTDDRQGESSMGIAASRDASTVFVGDAVDDEVVVIDADDRRVIKRIEVEHQVHAVDIGPEGDKLWVAGVRVDVPWLSATTVIDVESLQRERTFSESLGNAAHFTFTPDGEQVWAASVTTNLVWVNDAATGELVDTIAVGPGELDGDTPEAREQLIGLNEIAITPDGSRAFATGPQPSAVFVIDVDERRLVERIDLDERPHGIAVGRDGREVWTANNTGSVTVIDAESLEITDRIDVDDEVGEMPFAHVAFSIDGRHAYLSWSEHLSVIEVDSREVVDTIETDTVPHEISLRNHYVDPGQIIVAAGGGADDAGEHDNRQAGDSKTSQAAGIELTATPKRTDEGLDIEITIDTHAGDLLDYDIVDNITVDIDGKSVATEQLRWDPTSETAHHRRGMLVVDADADVDKGSTLHLVFEDLGVDERSLSWERLP